MVTKHVRVFYQKHSLYGYARLCYDSVDPYAVSITFLDEEDDPKENITWVFARSLLADAVEFPDRDFGMGDVRVRCSRHGMVLLTLLGEETEQAVINIARFYVTNFLRQSFAEVPLGGEVVNVDDTLARIFHREEA